MLQIDIYRGINTREGLHCLMVDQGSFTTKSYSLHRRVMQVSFVSRIPIPNPEVVELQHLQINHMITTIVVVIH